MSRELLREVLSGKDGEDGSLGGGVQKMGKPKPCRPGSFIVDKNKQLETASKRGGLGAGAKAASNG